MRKVLVFAAFIFVISGITTQAQTIRVKCGGSGLTDSKGQVWSADKDFNGGLVSVVTGSVSGTADPELFQGGRMPSDSGPLVYSFPVTNGSYHANLYFAELYGSDAFAGGRVFNVKVEGTTILQNFDVFKTVGAAKALVKGVDFAVSDGHATIELDNVAGHDRGKIAAIEITENGAAGSTGPTLTLNFVHPDGTPVAGTLNYTMSTSAIKLAGNTPLTNGQATCQLFTSPQSMGLTGQFNLTLSLTDTSGKTLWQIAMVMDPTNVNFGSVQSSALSVVVQK